MLLSKDLLVFEFNDADFKYIYNKFTHQLTKIHKALYEYLLDMSIDDEYIDTKDLSADQVDTLLEHGVLIENNEKYLAKKFKPSLSWDFKIKTVYIHITMLCNLNCEYCYNIENINPKDKELTTEQWLQVLGILKQEGVEKLIFTGGEPLMHNDLMVIIRTAKSLGFTIALLTNGTKIDLIASEFEYIDECIISLDGLSLSKRKGIEAYNIIDKIIDLSKKYIDKITVRSVVVHDYEDEVVDLAYKLSGHGINHIKSICLPYGGADLNCIPDYDKYNLIDVNSVLEPCGAGIELIAIDSIGNIFPCQTLISPEFLIANIFDSDWISKIHASKTCNEISNFQVYNDPNCQACDAKHFCKGGCRGLAYSVYKDISHRNEFLCDYYRKCVKKQIENICN